MLTTTSRSIAIWGASGHGRVVLDAIRFAQTATVVGFIDDAPELRGHSFAGHPVLGGREVLPNLLAQGVKHIHIAIGHCAARLRVAKIILDSGLAVHTVVHPRSIIASDATLGEGTFVAAGAVVNSVVQVGRNVILNTGCIVDHESVLGDGVHVGPGARLGGLVRVGAGTFIGIGATVINCVGVGAGSIVGAGAVVVRNLPDSVVAYGVPARVARRLPQ